VIIEIAVQDLNNSERCFEKARRLVDGVKKLVLIDLGYDG
jgi:hypothetical protein